MEVVTQGAGTSSTHGIGLVAILRAGVSIWIQKDGEAVCIYLFQVLEAFGSFEPSS